jgi:hypothetical protein
MSETKTLHLTLKKKWFDMTKAKIKREEYRDIIPFWAKRLIDVDNSLDESKGESKVVHDNICYDIVVNGFDPDKVLKSYRSKFKPFTDACARHGYARNAPELRERIESISIGEGRPEWGAEPGKKYFVIKYSDL